MILFFYFLLLLLLLVLYVDIIGAIIKEEEEGSNSPGYFDHLFDLDRLENDDSTIKRLDSNEGGDSSSNVMFYDIIGTTTTTTNETTIRLRHAHITTFLPYTFRDRIRTGVLDDSFALLLAIHQFNHKQITHVISSSSSNDDNMISIYKSCNVRLTTTIYDSKLSPTETTRLLSDVLSDKIIIQEQPRFPLPVAVIGPYESQSTTPAAIISGVNEIIHLSHHASSMDFNNKNQFPMFGRTVPSSFEDAQITIQYLQTLNVDHVGIIYVNDDSGVSFHKAFRDVAAFSEPRIRTRSFPISTNYITFIRDDLSFNPKQLGEEMTTALTSLKETGVRYIVALVNEESYDLLMHKASIQGIVGKDYFWLFPFLMNREVFQANARYPKDSTIAKATDGIGIIQHEGKESFRTIHMLQKQDSIHDDDDDDGEVPKTGFDKFRATWKKAVKDEDMVNFAKSKQPLESMKNNNNSTNIFRNEPSKDSYFLYDAVISLGLSMCYAPSELLKGGEIFKNFTHDVQFEGASGMFQINNETGSRDHKSLVSTIWNVRAVPDPTDDSFIVFDLVPTMNYMRNSFTNTDTTDPTWTRYISTGQQQDPQKIVLDKFIYSSGSTQAPKAYELISSREIGVIPRLIGNISIIMVAILAVLGVVWTFIYRETKVVKVSHPLFLNVVTLGCLIMSLSVVPVTLDESKKLESKRMDNACMLSLWLINIGFALPLSAFSTKIWMSHKKDPSIQSEYVSFNVGFFCKTLIPVLSFETILLLVWTIFFPMKWQRITISKPNIPRPYTETYGQCSSEHNLEFAIILAVFHLIWIGLSLILTYRTDTSKLPYKNSDFNNIVLVLAAVSQTWIVSIPLMFIISDSPLSSYWMTLALVIISSLTILLLVFIPKHLEIRKDNRIARIDQMRRAQLGSAPTRTTIDGNNDSLSDDHIIDDNTSQRDSR